MQAKMLSADDAIQAGLVNGVFSPDTIASEVTKIANEFSRCAPLTLQASKALVGRVQAQRRASLEAGDDWVTTCYMSDDFKAAVDKFVNKTSFEWTGR